MAGFFLKPGSSSSSSGSSRGHARSISLPARSHPTTLKIEQELNNLHSTIILEVSPSSSSSKKSNDNSKLCIAISRLVGVYKSVGDLLKLPQTQQALTKHRDSSFVNDILEESVSFLDVCGNIRESISVLKESVGELQSTLRRRHNEGDINGFTSTLRNLKKELGKSLASLKQIDHRLASSASLIDHENDHHLVAVVRVVRETSLMSSAVLRAVLGWFSVTSSSLQLPIKKGSKWSLVLLRLVQNKKLGDGSGNGLNELEEVEVALNSLMVGKIERQLVITIQYACEKLSLLETRIEGFDKELECLYKELIQARVSLLNILSDN